VQVNEKSWDEFYGRFQAKTGLDLHLYKAEQLRRRIISMSESKGKNSLAEFWGWIAESHDNVQWFQDKLAINVSELFRNPEKWTELQEQVIPDLLSRSSKLKCWSAGCSYGAEAHSLATVFAEKIPGAHQIIGTDIDKAALDQAIAGTFSEADMKCMPPLWRDKYYTKLGEEWQASQEVRKYCSFRVANILDKPTDSGFDLILCRNVVIYFTESAKDKLYERFFWALKPGGVLFVGGTERIFRSREMGFTSPVPFFYQKPINGDTVWQNAS
jgi:chemotaxis protein methyltransferase CheR